MWCPNDIRGQRIDDDDGGDDDDDYDDEDDGGNNDDDDDDNDDDDDLSDLYNHTLRPENYVLHPTPVPSSSLV